MSRSKAVVLLSGGLDSATVLAVAQQQGFEACVITFDYEQRHRFELHAAQKIARQAGVTCQLQMKVDLRGIGGSALTSDMAVPQDRSIEQIQHGVPVTYVPARNTIFLSIALGWAEVLGAYDLFIGVNAVDFSGYPDCRPEFLAAFEQLANLATKATVEGKTRFTVHAPLLHMTKAQIIRLGHDLGVDFSSTHTCYDPDEAGLACGRCDACRLRLRGFAECHLTDPAAYQQGPVA